MMSVSIAELGNLEPIETMDLDLYQEETPRSTFQLPEAGRYTLRAPDSFTSEAFSKSTKGALVARIDPTIVGPTNEGFTIRYTRVSAAPFKNREDGSSFMTQYLKSCGIGGKITSVQQLADAVASTAGRIYEADLDWVAEHRDSGFKVVGMKNFPVRPDGSRQWWVEHPTLKGEDGNALRVRANVVVRRYIAQAN